MFIKRYVPEAGSDLIPTICLLCPPLRGTLCDLELVLGIDGIIRGREAANLATIVTMAYHLHLC